MVSLFSRILRTVWSQSCAFVRFSCCDYLLPTSFVLLRLCVVLISLFLLSLHSDLRGEPKVWSECMTWVESLPPPKKTSRLFQRDPAFVKQWSSPVVCWWLWKEPCLLVMRWECRLGDAQSYCRCSKWPSLVATAMLAVKRLMKSATALLMCFCGSSSQNVCSATSNSSVVLGFSWS